jgi:hypothetical protein
VWISLTWLFSRNQRIGFGPKWQLSKHQATNQRTYPETLVLCQLFEFFKNLGIWIQRLFCSQFFMNPHNWSFSSILKNFQKPRTRSYNKLIRTRQWFQPMFQKYYNTWMKAFLALGTGGLEPVLGSSLLLWKKDRFLFFKTNWNRLSSRSSSSCTNWTGNLGLVLFLFFEKKNWTQIWKKN